MENLGKLIFSKKPTSVNTEAFDQQINSKARKIAFS